MVTLGDKEYKWCLHKMYELIDYETGETLPIEYYNGDCVLGYVNTQKTKVAVRYTKYDYEFLKHVISMRNVHCIPKSGECIGIYRGNGAVLTDKTVTLLQAVVEKCNGVDLYTTDLYMYNADEFFKIDFDRGANTYIAKYRTLRKGA